MRRVILSSLAVVLALASVRATMAADVVFRLADANNAAVADAIVSLYALDDSASPDAAVADAPAAEVMQKDQEFVPYVTAVRVGTTVIFPNQDSVHHHIYSISKPKRFEIPLHGKDEKGSVVFDQPGVVALGCNIHDWMVGYIVVLATPHFAKSGADGVVQLGDVPAGKYRAEIWHPLLNASVVQEITVGDGAASAEHAVSLKLKKDRRIRRAPNAGRGGYP